MGGEPQPDFISNSVGWGWVSAHLRLAASGGSALRLMSAAVQGYLHGFLVRSLHFAVTGLAEWYQAVV